MCSHEPTLLKPHNKEKISFKNHFTNAQNILYKTYNIHQFKSFKPSSVLK